MKSTSVIKNIKGKILGYFAKTKGDDYSTFFKTIISNEFYALTGNDDMSSSIFYDRKFSFIYINGSTNNRKLTFTLMTNSVIIQGLVLIGNGDLIIQNVNGNETFSFVDNITPDFVVGNAKLYLIKEPLIFTR